MPKQILNRAIRARQGDSNDRKKRGKRFLTDAALMFPHPTFPKRKPEQLLKEQCFFAAKAETGNAGSADFKNGQRIEPEIKGLTFEIRGAERQRGEPKACFWPSRLD